MIRDLHQYLDAFMDVQWPMVITAVFLMCIVVIGLFGIVFYQLQRAQLNIVKGIREMHDEARVEREGLMTEMSSNTEQIQQAVSDQADAVLEEVDERQAERVSGLIESHHD